MYGTAKAPSTKSKTGPSRSGQAQRSRPSASPASKPSLVSASANPFYSAGSGLSLSTAGPAVAVQTKLEVGAADDSYEREADAVADGVVQRRGIAPISRIPSTGLGRSAQRIESEEAVQRQADEEEPVQASLQRQAAEEEPVQASPQRQGAEEEPVQASLQRQAAEEEPVQASLQRQAAEEEPVQTSLQRQAAEEEPVQASVQRQATEEEPVQALLQRQGAEEEPVQASVQRQSAEEEPVQASLQRQAADEEPVQASLQRQAAEEEPVQPAPSGAGSNSTAAVPASTTATVRSPGSGDPMRSGIRGRIEPHVGADLSGVRIHTGASAHRATASLNARAFTHGSDIFLGRSESSADVALMAHESTHVVQQGAAPVQRKAATSPTERKIQRLIPDFILEELNDYAGHIPGYDLFTVIVGYNPLLGRSVDRNATNLLRGLMGLAPGGRFIFDKLEEHGIIRDAFVWVEGKLEDLDLSIGRIEDTVEDAWDDVDLLEGFDYNLRVVKRHFGALYDDVETFAGSLVDHLIQLIKDVAIGLAEDLLAENNAWDLIKKILKKDPLRDEKVESTTVEILEDFLILIGKEAELEQMRERGTLEKTAAWIDTQFGTFMGLLSQLGELFSAAWDAIQPENLPDLATNLRSLADGAIAFLQGVWDFAITVAETVLQLIKDSLLNWLKSFATDIPGYHLLTVMLEKDIFTDEHVPRTPTNLIRGFMSLMPGGEAQFQELSETGVIPKAAQRIEQLMTDLGISWEFVKGLFLGLWDTLSIEDIFSPVEAFQRVMDKFGEPISRLFTFVIEVIKVILELILAIMNFPGELLGSIIGKTMRAIEDIANDPIKFLKNMLKAVKRGFSLFFDNILTHLLNGVTEWLFGRLEGAGIQPPPDLSLGSILDLVLQILGITVDRLWEKLADRIGQEKVDRIRGAIDRLTGIWNFVRDVQERGVAAIWEYIESQISNLWDMVIEQARNWIVTRVIERVVTKLISMLDPTGVMAVVNSFIAFFNAVQSAIEYFREMLEIVDNYVSTVAAIARGDVEPGAVKLETGLANSIPVAIGFLANQVGLGNLADKIQEIVEGIRETVDMALDWLMDQAMSLGQSVLRMFGVGGASDDESEQEEELDPTDHGSVVTRAIAEMETPGEPVEDYDSLRSQKQSQARQIEERYSAMLGPGVGLFVRFRDPSSDRSDDDLDFSVTVAPNDETGEGTVPVRIPRTDQVGIYLHYQHAGSGGHTPPHIVVRTVVDGERSIATELIVLTARLSQLPPGVRRSVRAVHESFYERRVEANVWQDKFTRFCTSVKGGVTARIVSVGRGVSYDEYIPVHPNEAEAAYNYQNGIINTNVGQYTSSNNCVTHVQNVLARAGIPGAAGLPNYEGELAAQVRRYVEEEVLQDFPEWVIAALAAWRDDPDALGDVDLYEHYFRDWLRRNLPL